MKNFMINKIWIRILLIIVISFSIIFTPITQEAGIGDDMERVFHRLSFRSSVTEPGVYKSQKGGIITGGSLVLRGGNLMNPPLFTLVPPRIEAGCGGIDIFFGAFQFVNAEQLVNMLKNIGSAAIGYAFKLGLEAVCPTCNAVLNELSNFANQLAKLASDSCQFGQFLVNQIRGSIGSSVESGKAECRRVLAEEEKDLTKAEKKCDGDRFLEEIAKKTRKFLENLNSSFSGAELPKIEVPGSVVETSLKQVNFAADDIIIIRSFLGDIVLEGNVENKEIPKHTYYEPTITLADLMYGNPDAEFLIFDNSTKKMKKEKRSNYLPNGGIKIKVYNFLKSILEKIKGGVELLAEEKQFIENSPFPILSLFQDATKVPGLAEAILETTSDTIAVMYAYSLGDYYIRSVLFNLNKQPHVPIQDAVAKFTSRKQELLEELKKELDVLKTQYTALTLTSFYLQQVRKNVAFQLEKK